MVHKTEGNVAFITGVTGQDGAFLAKTLLNAGVRVFGGVRRGSSPKDDRLKRLGIFDKITFVPLEITEFSNVMQILSDVRPNYVYNLAAQSFVVDSFRHPIITTQINYIGVLNILESIRLLKLDTKVFQPSTSEMYGDGTGAALSEVSNFDPLNPYALSKHSAHAAIKIYRKVHNIRAMSAILFNHESELRGREFVTRKITMQLAHLKAGNKKPLQLGNLSAERDWGYANDYVKAMKLILENDIYEDFIVATNTLHSVREFLSLAATSVGFTPEFEGEGVNEKCFDRKSGLLLCEVKKEFFRSHDTKALKGDYSKIKAKLDWAPDTSFEKLVETMASADLKNLINNDHGSF